MDRPVPQGETYGMAKASNAGITLMALRLAVALSLIAVFGDVPGFAQIGYPGGGIGYPGGGIGYPGGGVGYPGGGGGYPGGGGGYPGGNRRGQNNRPMNSVSGRINRISMSQLVLDSDDGTQLQIMLDRNTRYFDTSGGNARYGDFNTGDQVSVDAAMDNQNYMHGIRVSMLQRGSGSNSGSNQSGSSADRSEPPASSSGSADDDPDRPRLKRSPTSGGSSGSSDSASASPSPSSNSSSSGSTTAAPRPVARESDDPGPPVLKRNAPARVDNTPPAGAEVAANPSDPVAQARAIAERYKNPLPEVSASLSPPVSAAPAPMAAPAPSVRPSRASADSAPSATPSAVVAPDPGPSSLKVPERGEPTENASRAGSVFGGPRASDPVIQSARDAAAQFTDSLPNYVVKQFTTRYQTDAAHGNRTSWQALDIVTADVVCENGKESYKNILVNGKPPRDDIEKSGSWSTGEFATVLQGILAPYTDADFHNKRSVTINRHAAFEYDYTVDQPRSGWHVFASSESYVPGYTGSIWIDKETFRVLRIEMSAVNMPKSFALDAVESAVDYDYVMISDQQYLLPTHSEALSCMRGTSECTRNVIEFRNYKKFGADTSITFDKP